MRSAKLPGARVPRAFDPNLNGFRHELRSIGSDERLPANLLQAQRDFFGAHTYERLDKLAGEFFHTEDWPELISSAGPTLARFESCLEMIKLLFAGSGLADLLLFKNGALRFGERRFYGLVSENPREPVAVLRSLDFLALLSFEKN